MSQSASPVASGNDQGLDRRKNTTTFQRVMGVLAWVMVFVGSGWITFGHMLMSGGGGWVLFFHLFGLLPIFAIVTLVHAGLVTAYSGRVRSLSAGPRAAMASLIFFCTTGLYPFFVSDVGDTSESMVPSRATAWLGVSDEASAIIAILCLGILVVSALAMIILDIVDLVQARPRYSLVNGQIPAAVPVDPPGSDPDDASDRWRPPSSSLSSPE